MRIHPGASLVAMLVAAAAMESLLPAGIDIPLSSRGVASGFMLLSAAALLFWAIRVLEQRSSTIEPHQEPSAIVTCGPFRFSRNPMYLANLMMILGFAFMTGSAWFLAAAFAQFIVLNVWVIPPEEEYLKKTFPEIARQWFSVTRRWI